ncbi:MAG TPA: alpha/beta hydrolase family protein [Verrucomicrobiae bacterium]|nr:alpha/beta hydrolase family protein [Verrucomicrobiae bacterium]
MTRAEEIPLVPEGAFAEEVPPSAERWEDRKRAIRATLWELFWDLPPQRTPAAVVDRSERREGYRLEHITFGNGVGHTVFGYAMIPDDRGRRAPAVLYHHYHGGRYANGKEEALDRTAFDKYGNLGFAPAERLAQMGYVVVAIDAYAFGERRWQGPAGKKEEGRQTEWALAKTFLWAGRNLWAMMVLDDILALNYLCGRPEVDPDRVACMGMSMGATRSWWLAAMDDRIKACVSVSCLTRYQNLIAAGAVNQHGFYYFVPGMLRRGIDAEAVIGCIAPRAHLTLSGDEDAGSPVDGIRMINAFQERIYGLYGRGDCFRGIVYEKTGHVWSPAMWDETIAWLKRHIGEPEKGR